MIVRIDLGPAVAEIECADDFGFVEQFARLVVELGEQRAELPQAFFLFGAGQCDHVAVEFVLLHRLGREVRIVLRRPNGELVSDPEPSFAGRALEYYNREQAEIVAAEQGCKVEFIGLQDRLVKLSKLNPENLTDTERSAMAEYLAREAAQREAAQRASEQNRLAAAQYAEIQSRNAKRNKNERVILVLSALSLLLGFLWVVYGYKPDPELVARHKAVVEACEKSGGKYVPNTKFTRGVPECQK